MENSDVQTQIELISLGLTQPFLIQALEYFSFKYATPVQALCIPQILNNQNLIIQAKNGTGKTLAFSLSALEKIDPHSVKPQVLILTSTREVANQINDIINELTYTCDPPIYSLLCCGGYSRKDTISALKQGVHIIIGTIGRVKDLASKEISLESLELLVLDEADKICTDLEAVFTKINKNCQILAFSATYTETAEKWLNRKMIDCKTVKVSGDDQKLKLLQEFYVDCEENFNKKLLKVLEILNSIPFHQCIIFHNYKIHGKDLAGVLRDHGFKSLNISGDLKQEQRIEVMRNLRFFQIRIMLSTDISSRGIDVHNVNLVVNFDFPVSKEVYIHRVGRAGRFGSPGISVTLCTSEDHKTTLNTYSTVHHISTFSKENYQIDENPIIPPEPTPEDPEGWVDISPSESPSLKFTHPITLSSLQSIFCDLCQIPSLSKHCHCEVCRENYTFISKYLK